MILPMIRLREYFISLFVVVFVVLVSLSCDRGNVSEVVNTEKNGITPSDESADPSGDRDLPYENPYFRVDLAAEAMTEEIEEGVAASNRMGIDALKFFCGKKDGNFMISPVSMTVAMGILAEGARGETLDDISEVFGTDREGFRTLCLNLKVFAQRSKEATTVKFADLVAVNQKYVLYDRFIEAVMSWFDAQVATLNFSNTSESLQYINKWASGSTDGDIPALLDDINPDAIAYLMNSVFFNSTWRIQFDPNDTKDGRFTPEKGDVFKVKMMSMTAEMPYAELDGLRAVELDYGEGEYVMDIILPSEKTLTECVQEIDLQVLPKLLSRLKPRNVVLHLPRFTIEGKVEFNDYFSQAGLASLYDNPDLSGICEDGDICVSDIFQKSIITVGEKGTRAATATVIETDPTSAPPEDEDIFFFANKPFLFLIRECNTGAILFAGTYRSE